jgi:hypothetical protein
VVDVTARSGDRDMRIEGARDAEVGAALAIRIMVVLRWP